MCVAVPFSAEQIVVKGVRQVKVVEEVDQYSELLLNGLMDVADRRNVIHDWQDVEMT